MTAMTCFKLNKWGIIGLIIISCLAPATGWAGFKPTDQFVFDLINQFRAAPFDKAVSMGYDPAFLYALGITPESALPPYVPDEQLRLAASENNDKVLNPAPPAALLMPERTRMKETGSVLTFSNFLPIETAGSIFVRNLFNDELNSGQFELILSETMTHAGTSVVTGVVNGSNAWLFNLVVGSSVNVRDMQVLHLINQVRTETALIEQYIPSDLVTLIRYNWQLYYLLKFDFHPLFMDEFLYWSAGESAAGIEQEGIYPGDYFQNSTVTGAWEDIAAADPVTDLFSALLSKEFSTWPFSASVFSNRYRLAGTALLFQTGESFDTGILSFSAGSDLPAVPDSGFTAPARIYGLLFLDRDGNGIYSPGEEMAGHPVLVYDETLIPAAAAVTDNSGYFTLTLESERYWIFTAQDGDQVAHREILLHGNQFVKLGFVPPTPPLP